MLRPALLSFVLVAALVPLHGAQAAPGVLETAGERGARDDWTWTLILPRGFAIGGGGLDADDVRYVHAEGFRAILNYRAEHPDDAQTMAELGMEYLFLPNRYAESDTMPLGHVHEAVAFLERMVAEDKPVYVHCTGGWHRSAVGVLAYYMKTNRWRLQQAFDHVNSIRPGIELRYADVLYEYEAWLFGQEKLTLDLWTTQWDVVVGQTVDVMADVTHNGRPVPGALVRFAVEKQGVKINATTDENGRAVFPFTAPQVDLMQYVRATASKPGFVHGYDRNVFWVKESKVAPPTILKVGDYEARVEPGGTVVLPLKVREEGGKPTNGRITITTPCATLHRAYTGWSGRANVTFQVPAVPGDYTLHVRVNRFPAQPLFREISLVVGDGGPPPTCEEAFPAAPRNDPAFGLPPEPSAESPRLGSDDEASQGGAVPPGGSAPRAVVGPQAWLVALAVFGASVVWRRRS